MTKFNPPKLISWIKAKYQRLQSKLKLIDLFPSQRRQYMDLEPMF